MTVRFLMTVSESTEAEDMAVHHRVVSQARGRLSQHHHFRCHNDAIDIGFDKGKLVLLGRLPSFYLKQVLQTVLRDLPDVSQIENRVDVVSSDGLSSVRKKPSSEV